MSIYEVIDHPSDLKIRVKGKNYSDLFSNTAAAIAELQFSFDRNAGLSKEEKIEIESENMEMLLVEFLSEIIYLNDANNLAYTDIKVDEITEKKMRCRARGVPIIGSKIEIKAATYHETEIKKTADGYEAVILFDI